MKKNIFLLFIVLVISMGFQSCSEDKEGNTAKIQLKLVDAPGDYTEVNVEIIDIQYTSSEDDKGWKSFTPESGFPMQIDLTKLIAGNSFLLADELIESGMLHQIRLVLSDNNYVVIEGIDGDIRLETPSAQQSGLKIKLDKELEPGFSYTFILDWDVEKSIVKAANSGQYLLKPVIRANVEVNSGSIQGKVTTEAMEGDGIDGAIPLMDILVAVYTSEDVYIAESRTNENGDFIIQGLPEGDYKIKIENTNYMHYESSENIEVIVGEVTKAGIIELKIPVT